MNSNSNNNDRLDPDADARIDAMARAAGGELRRPAPADGLARAHGAKRRSQAIRATAGGVAAVALVGAGVFAFTRGDDRRVLQVDTTVETPTSPVPVDTTVETPTTPVPVDTTEETPTTPVPPNSAGDPEVVYSTTGYIGNPDYLETVIDPVTGQVVGTGTPDGQASSEAQLALIDQFVYDGESVPLTGVLGYRLESGDIAYTYGARGTDSPGLEDEDPAVLALFDRCEQFELTVEGADRGALPARVQRLTMSLDRRWLAVVSSECPVEGTLVGQNQVAASTSTAQVFDASNPDEPGLQLMSTTDRIFFRSMFFSPDGGYSAVEAAPGFRVFDLADGSEVEVAESGCRFLGSRYARSSGPWVGASSLAVSLDCPGEPVSLLVVDVASGEELRVPAPVAAGLPVDGSVDGPLLEVEVDVAHFDRPSNAWFTLCERSTEDSNCWYGQGNAEPVEIPGAQEASFLPLGFTFGG